MGGNVRVGLEGSLWINRGKLARSKAEQDRQVRAILQGLGLEIATPATARAMLQQKGADQVGY